jgi:cytosine/adenosine deaminase-related metal-dependent hydrolase
LQAVAQRGAAIVICPSTEANLGDGVFDYPAYAAAGAARSDALKVFCRLSGVPEMEIRTDDARDPWPQRLQKFLHQAAKRRVA